MTHDGSDREDQGDRLINRVTGPISRARRRITGTDVAESIEEYAETFTQVSLGLHDDITAPVRRIVETEEKLAELLDRPIPHLGGSGTRFPSPWGPQRSWLLLLP